MRRKPRRSRPRQRGSAGARKADPHRRWVNPRLSGMSAPPPALAGGGALADWGSGRERLLAGNSVSVAVKMASVARVSSADRRRAGSSHCRAVRVVRRRTASCRPGSAGCAAFGCNGDLDGLRLGHRRHRLRLAVTVSVTAGSGVAVVVAVTVAAGAAFALAAAFVLVLSSAAPMPTPMKKSSAAAGSRIRLRVHFGRPLEARAPHTGCSQWAGVAVPKAVAAAKDCAT